MNNNQRDGQKQSTPDNSVNDPMKDLTATAGQGSQQSGQQQGQQSSQQQGNQQQGKQQQGNQQQGRQGGNQQQGGGQHASGGTPALDDLDGQNQGESAQQASEAFKQQGDRGGNR
ncbi:MAG: hypothetical protein EOP92_38205 [Lysobacteraceae bacterium]|nr:MAG: hypothetical protein EOP92_38205 [Xanthomonadaceae bacterium]